MLSSVLMSRVVSHMVFQGVFPWSAAYVGFALGFRVVNRVTLFGQAGEVLDAVPGFVLVSASATEIGVVLVCALRAAAAEFPRVDGGFLLPCHMGAIIR